jgi:hypothetical protein
MFDMLKNQIKREVGKAEKLELYEIVVIGISSLFTLLIVTLILIN